MVYNFYKSGQRGYHGASLQLDADCFVTPYLIYTWVVMIEAGFVRGHPVLHEKFSISIVPDSKHLIKTIFLYMNDITEKDEPNRQSIMPAIQYYCSQTKKHLFGTSSCNRNRSP